MKTINKIIATCVGLFLFFTFSNFNSLDDIFQSFSSSEIEIAANSKEENIREKAIVKAVIDGDTFKAEFSNGEVETIRLLLIDTPETVSPNVPEQPYGKEASDFLKRHLIRHSVVEIEKGIEERDKYNRLLAYVWRDGKNINKALLEEGLARVAYIYEPNTKYLNEFKRAERKAKEERKGIWSIDGYVTEKGFNYP
jgi:micrococcal nuclease